jgi:hypothetical protein
MYNGQHQDSVVKIIIELAVSLINNLDVIIHR